MEDSMTCSLVESIHHFMFNGVPSLQRHYQHTANNINTNNEQYQKERENYKQLSHWDEQLEMNEQLTSQIFSKKLLVYVQNSQSTSGVDKQHFCNVNSKSNMMCNMESIDKSRNNYVNMEKVSTGKEIQPVYVRPENDNKEKEETYDTLSVEEQCFYINNNNNKLTHSDTSNELQSQESNVNVATDNPNLFCKAELTSLSSSCASLPCPHELPPVPIPASASPERKEQSSHAYLHCHESRKNDIANDILHNAYSKNKTSSSPSSSPSFPLDKQDYVQKLSEQCTSINTYDGKITTSAEIREFMHNSINVKNKVLQSCAHVGSIRDKWRKLSSSHDMPWSPMEEKF